MRAMREVIIIIIFVRDRPTARASLLACFLIRVFEFCLILLVKSVDDAPSSFGFQCLHRGVGRDVGRVIGRAEFCCARAVEFFECLLVLRRAEDFGGGGYCLRTNG